VCVCVCVCVCYSCVEVNLIGLDDTTMDDGNAEIVPTTLPKLKSTIMGGTYRLDDGGPDNTKRKSFRKETEAEHNSHFATQK
jgi:hypothetical protein